MTRKGLLGTDQVEGGLWITRCPSVHMIGMRYPIDAPAGAPAEGASAPVRSSPFVGTPDLTRWLHRAA